MLSPIFTFFTRPENILFVPVFLIIITVLVAAHEYGHYLFARIFGMGVEEFAIGFGTKPLWVYGRRKYRVPLDDGQVPSKDRLDGVPEDEKAEMAKVLLKMEGKQDPSDKPVVIDTPDGKVLEETTKFTVRPLPLGGFVRIKGMMPEEDGSETQIPGGFYSKEPWKRFIVLLAGPVFSILAGVILIFLLNVTVGEQVVDNKPLIGIVSVGSPAEAAGFHQGDRILSVDSAPVHTFFDFMSRIRYAGAVPHRVTYERDGKQFTTTVTPIVDAQPSPVFDSNLKETPQLAKQAKIGATLPITYTYRPMPFKQATIEAVMAPVVAVEDMGSLFATPSKIKDAVGGPITMLRETRSAIELGFSYIVTTAAILSISVGIFNLLPIVPLDGGQMAIAVAEMFRRRRLSMRVQNMAAAAGMFVVLMMVIAVMTIDIQRLGQPEGPKFSDLVKTNPPAKPPKH